MENPYAQPEITVEPVEEYLALSMCDIKLAVYQPIFDLFKVNERRSALDSLNLIVLNVNEESFQDKADRVHDMCIELLEKAIAEFGVITSHASIKLLTNIYHALTVLDIYEEHDFIVNIIDDESLDQTDKLYALINAIHKVDDQEFYNCVKVVSLNLLEKVKEVHLAGSHDVQTITEHVEFDTRKTLLLRDLAKRYPQLIAVNLIRDHLLHPNMTIDAITSIVARYIDSYDVTDAKRLALEILAIYLISREPLDQLVAVTKSQLVHLINDDKLVMAVNASLTAEYVEIMSYVKERVFLKGH